MDFLFIYESVVQKSRAYKCHSCCPEQKYASSYQKTEVNVTYRWFFKLDFYDKFYYSIVYGNKKKKDTLQVTATIKNKKVKKALVTKKRSHFCGK